MAEQGNAALRLPPPPQGEQAQVAYAIFEGGGARGITHIGAAKALERENIEIVGVAGASAGAIIAALLAAGFSADELFDPVTGTDLLTPRSKTPISLLGETAWSGFTALRQRLAGFNAAGTLALIAACLALLVGAIWWLDRWAALLLLLSLLAASGAVLMSWLRPLVQPLLRRLGLFDTASMAEELNAILREKLQAHYLANGDTGRVVPDVITFESLDPVDGGVGQCRRLKIVVSDIANGSVRIFDRTTPGVCVADAVAASASIPFFFSPPTVRGAAEGLFADGGLVSNLPVWVFAKDRKRLERDLEQRIPVMAFKLLDSAAPPDASRSAAGRFAGHVGRVLRTGIFGSQSIIADILPDVLVVGLPSRLGTFQFDMSRQQAIGAYQDGLLAAAVTLARRRIEQQLLDQLLADLRAEAIAMLPPEINGPDTRLRVSLYDPDRRFAHQVESFQVIASAGMESDADSRLAIDSRGRGVPLAWAKRCPVYVADLLQGTPKSRHATRAEDALIWPELKSLIAVPIFAQPQFARDESQIAQRILCIDANVDLRLLFEDRGFQLWLDDRIVLLSLASVEEQVDEFTKAV